MILQNIEPLDTMIGKSIIKSHPAILLQNNFSHAIFSTLRALLTVATEDDLLQEIFRILNTAPFVLFFYAYSNVLVLPKSCIARTLTLSGAELLAQCRAKFRGLED